MSGGLSQWRTRESGSGFVGLLTSYRGRPDWPRLLSQENCPSRLSLQGVGGGRLVDVRPYFSNEGDRGRCTDDIVEVSWRFDLSKFVLRFPVVNPV